MTNPQHNRSGADPVPGSSLNLADIYFVLFRRKWLIITCTLFGVAAAVSMVLLSKPLYGSQAKLLIRYIVETRATLGEARETQSPDRGGDNIINSEIEILTSLDLCKKVAATVGPARILDDPKRTNDVIAASVAISKGLTAEAPKFSNVIRVSAVHSDPQVVQELLTQLIEAYQARHAEIHQSLGASERAVSQQTELLRTSLTRSEEDLAKQKAKLGILSLDSTKASYSARETRLTDEILTARAQLAEYQALTPETVALSTTNEVNDLTIAVPTEIVEKFQQATTRLLILRQKEFDYSLEYADVYPLLLDIREQIAVVEAMKLTLLDEHPSLTSVIPQQRVTTSAGGVAGVATSTTTIAGIQARIRVLNEQLAQVQTNGVKLSELETSLLQLERKKELEEKNYRDFAARLEQARFDQALSSSQLSNLSIVQAPIAPYREKSTVAKMAVMALMGGMGGGIVLAFLIEVFLKQTLKRPSEIESKLHIPLFFSIPYLHTRQLSAAKQNVLDAKGTIAVETHYAPWISNAAMRPHIEALRDRTLMHFEGVKKKPKLIGLGSCSEGTGVTTLASGLAGALSEVADGKVLLVDLSMSRTSIHPFANGKPGWDLCELLETQKQEDGKVLDRLYMASVNSEVYNGSLALPKRLASIIPRLKASDYDYIVFEMPRISRASITPRIAATMDLFLLVAESEKEPREILRQAGELLLDTGAPVAGVLNKVQSYVPQWLHREF